MLKVTKGTHILVIWVLTPCLVCGYVRFGGTVCLYIHGFTLKVEVPSSCEMLLPQLILLGVTTLVIVT
jgi:hypothetical protein